MKSKATEAVATHPWSKPAIVCGSWSGEELWQPVFEALLVKRLIDVSTFGRLPEVMISLTDDLHILSFGTAEGQPRWTLFDRRSASVEWIVVRGGKMVEEIGT